LSHNFENAMSGKKRKEKIAKGKKKKGGVVGGVRTILFSRVILEITPVYFLCPSKNYVAFKIINELVINHFKSYIIF
jgi:hypothetical protein